MSDLGPKVLVKPGSALTTFKDHFSGHADDYRRFRPTYPSDLFDYLADQATGHTLAWDCGTGNGQAATALRAHFERVVASDGSVQQVLRSLPTPGVGMVAAHAEAAPLARHSVDVVTVAQALHWFAHDAFFTEARRVARPGAPLAAWCYGRMNISPAVDAVIDGFWEDAIGPFWPPERRYIEAGYRTLPFPLARQPTPDFTMEAAWTLPALLGYLRSWSAVRRYQAHHGTDPVRAIEAPLVRAFGTATRAVRWPISIVLGFFP